MKPTSLAPIATVALLFAAAEAAAAIYRVTLPEAEGLLVQRNESLRAAHAATDVARSETTIAGRFQNPTFSFNHDHIPFTGRYSGSSTEPITGARFLVDNAVSAVLSWTLEIGKRDPRQESARNGTAAANAGAADLLRKKRSELRTAFIEALRASEELRLAGDVLQSHQETVRVNEARLKAGAIPEADLIKLRLETRTYATEMLQVELALAKARSDLHELLGLGREDMVVPVGQLADERLFAKRSLSARELLDRALALRPDFSSLRSQGARARSEVKLAQAQVRPDLTFSLGYLYDAPLSYLTYGISFPIPVAYRFRGEELRARADFRRVAHELEATRQRIAGEVREALHRFETARAQVALYRRGYLDQAAESHRIAERAYQRGGTSILELLEAQRTYVAVRREWLRALAELRASAVALNAAVGEEVLP